MIKRAERKGHRVTTANFQAVYPFQAEAGFGTRGAYIGKSALGSAFVFDPWELYNAGHLTNPNVMIFGEIGSGKSSLVKSFLHRQMIFRDRRAVIVDPKGEYEPLARAWGATPIKLTPGGSVRLNPLNPRGGEQGQMQLLLAVTAAALGRPMAPEETSAAIWALREANSKRSEPTLGDVARLLLTPTKTMARELSTTPSALAAAARPAGLALRNLCEGPMAGMFDGPSTTEVDFDQKVIVLDLSALQGTDSLGILMGSATAWLKAEIQEQRKNNSTVKTLWNFDEGWRILSHLGMGELLQDFYKHVRAYGICNIMVLHRLSDLTSAGDAGSRVERLARGLIEDSGTHVVYKQAPRALDGLKETFGISDTEADVIANNQRGNGLWMIGKARFIVRHDLSPDERAIIDTDQRMVSAAASEEIEAAA